MVQPNLGLNRMFVCCLMQIVQDRGPVGNGLGLGPRFEREAQRVHVRVRSNAWITEQVPCAANGRATFKNRVAFAGALAF